MKKIIGSKTASGVIQWIINQIPPHTWLIEAFGGSAYLTRQIAPAKRNTVIELDSDTAEALSEELDAEILRQDAFQFLEESVRQAGAERSFLYADPPYVHSSRGQSKIYRHEMSDPEHEKLCLRLKDWPGLVMLSGYDNAIYRDLLHDWRTAEFNVMTHTGPRIEKIWMNYQEPKRLHDYRFLGKDRTDRQRIRRKIERAKAKLADLPPLERHAIIDELLAVQLVA